MINNDSGNYKSNNNIITREIRLTESQLVDHWKVSKNTLRKWRTTGQGPLYIKIGGRVLYRKEDIDSFERNRLYRSSSERAKYEEI